MTKQLEDFFNLQEITVPETTVPSMAEQVSTALAVASELTVREKIDQALPLVGDLTEHDREMDDIAVMAIETFQNLVSLGNNVSDLHAGKIYEVAGQMLKTAMDARNSKTDRKLKMVDLQLKKLRADQKDPEMDSIASTGGEFDRNELLKHLVSVTATSSDK